MTAFIGHCGIRNRGFAPTIPERPPKRLQFQIAEPKPDPLRAALDEYAKEAGNLPFTKE
jgi:hypothetical protein